LLLFRKISRLSRYKTEETISRPQDALQFQHVLDNLTLDSSHCSTLIDEDRVSFGIHCYPGDQKVLTVLYLVADILLSSSGPQKLSEEELARFQLLMEYHTKINRHSINNSQSASGAC
jgi:hypothetical protein